MKLLSKTLVGICVLASISGCKKFEKIESTPVQSITVREYLDLNDNGGYESYQDVRESQGKREVIGITDFYPKGIYSIWFCGPPGGSLHEGESSRKQLETMFRLYNYPADVDSIRFIE